MKEMFDLNEVKKKHNKCKNFIEPDYHLSNGTFIDNLNNISSLCMDCDYSKTRCSWHKNLTLPVGAKFTIKTLHDNSYDLDRVIVIQCDNYIRMRSN